MDQDCTKFLSRLALGTWALAGEAPWGYGPCSEETARITVREALALGVRRFDTAALFGGGAVEDLLGRELAGRDDVRITTRIGVAVNHAHPQADFAPASLERQAWRSVERLQTPPDTILLHTPSPGVLKDRHVFRALARVRDQGACRRIGACVFEPAEAALALARGAEVICIPFNPANRKAERILKQARRAGAAVQVREVLHNGRLTDAPRNDFTRFDVRREWPPDLLERLDNIRGRVSAAVPGRTVVQAAVGYALALTQAETVVVGCRGDKQVRAAFAGAAALTEAEKGRVDTALGG